MYIVQTLHNMYMNNLTLQVYSNRLSPLLKPRIQTNKTTMKVTLLLWLIPFKFVFANSYDFIELFWTTNIKYLVLCSENIEDAYFEILNLKVHQGAQLIYWNCSTIPDVDNSLLILGGHP